MLIFVAVAVPLLVTAEGPGMVWDEGYTVDRVEKVAKWFDRLVRGELDWRQAISAQAIDHYWPFAREEPDGHPPLYALVAFAGWIVGRVLLPPLAAYRLGPILLIATTMTAAYVFLRGRLGPWPAAAAVLLCVYCPRLFSHAHFALYDMPLACWWLLTAIAFWRAAEAAQRSWWQALSWSGATAVLLAACAATKFTGWLVPVPLLVATWICWPRAGRDMADAVPGPGMRAKLLLTAVTALPIVVGAWPVLRQVRTLERIDGELRRELAAVEPARQRLIPRLVADRYRREHPSEVPGWLLFGAGPLLAAFALVRFNYPQRGRRFTAWELWFVLLGLTPLATVMLVPSWWPDPVQRIALFLWSNLTRARTTWIPTLFFGQVYEFGLPWYNTLAWLVLAMPPLTLLLVAIGLGAAVAGLLSRGRSGSGSAMLLVYLAIHAATLLVVRALPNAPGHDGIRQLVPSFVFLTLVAGGALGRSGAVVHRLLGGAAVLWTIAATAVYHPVQLSYYSLLVGGLPGATRLGMEPTYYWDALDARVRAWLTEHTSAEEKIAFSSLPLSFHYLRSWGYLPVRFLPDEPGRIRWYVLQNRPGMFVARPLDRTLAERGRAAYVRRRLGVPLIWVFPIEELDRLKRENVGGRGDAAGSWGGGS